MNKENNKSAAGLRRSAIAERIRLREEWSALKEVDCPTTSTQNVLKKKPTNSRYTPSASNRKVHIILPSKNKPAPKPTAAVSDILTGVVALVDIGCEDKALPLRALLTALGASVVMEWSPLVTHLIWTDSGTRALRARARALACRLVSPLWLEACAAATRRLSERMFPAASRHSDLPSPRKLRQLLKQAERENIPLVDLLSESKEEEMPRLRMRVSSETDTSREKSTDTSNETVDIESRVNTGRRGGTAPSSKATGGQVKPPQASREPPKSRRKLFTHKEAQDISSSDDDEAKSTSSKHKNKLTQSEKRDLARAERMAKKLLAACTQRNNNNNTTQHVKIKPRIVLTGMSRLERQAITKCIQNLDGVIKNNVTKRTTHVLLGSCNSNLQCNNHPSDMTGITTHCDLSKSSCWSDASDRRCRTLNALLGAARGSRVLHARWAVMSAQAGKWLHPHGFEVPHLTKICQKARVERLALGRQNSEYAYDVFSGMRVRISDDAEQRDAAVQLLTLCGAVIHNGGFVARQLDGQIVKLNDESGHVDIVIGNSVGEVNPKWVFDSVAVARMRTTRRYMNMNSYSELVMENR